jgi:23S rRNA (uridine2552-2'-O)-methyltransferase
MAADWRRETRRDPYHRAAKAGGYRARSAFKLKQIQERHRVMKKGGVVVDLGAAPGGWSQVAMEAVGEDGLVVAVDLAPMRPLPGVRMMKGDMTKEETVARLLEIIEERRPGATRAGVDAVLSDMSPKLSGTYSMDQARSYFLALHALRFAERVLTPGGRIALFTTVRGLGMRKALRALELLRDIFRLDLQADNLHGQRDPCRRNLCSTVGTSASRPRAVAGVGDRVRRRPHGQPGGARVHRLDAADQGRAPVHAVPALPGLPLQPADEPG